MRCAVAAPGRPAPERVARRRGRGALLAGLCLLAAATACSDRENEAFVKSHASLHAGQTLGEAFSSGLAGYMRTMGTKNVPGATIRARQPLGGGCRRAVLDILFTGTFRVRVYCDSNSPAARQIAPEGAFSDPASLARALEGEYRPWTADMEFRVESPPRKAFGVYDHYEFTTDADGRIARVSPIVAASSR